VPARGEVKDGPLTPARVRDALYKPGECQLIQALTIASRSARCRCLDSARQASELSDPELTGGAFGHMATDRARRSGDIRQGKEQ
jgi:hypothetical protein